MFPVIPLGSGPCTCDMQCEGTNVVCNEGTCECEPGFDQSGTTCQAGMKQLYRDFFSISTDILKLKLLIIIIFHAEWLYISQDILVIFYLFCFLNLVNN